MTSTPSTVANDHQDSLFKAVLYAMAAHFLFSVMSICAKLLSETHHVIEVAFYRNLIVLVPFFFVLYFHKQKNLFRPEKPRMVAFRAVVGSFSLILTYSALARLPMSYATVLLFTSTLLTPVFSFFVLKEYIGIHRWSAVFFGMIGVLVIARPSGAADMTGMFLALAAAFLHATMFITLRQLKSESPLTVTFYFVLAGMIVPAFAMPWVAGAIAMKEIWLFVLVALSSAIAQVCLASAYKYAQASLITPFAYSALLWTTMADVLIWQYPLDFTAIFTGASIMMAAQFYILYRENLRRKRAMQNV